MRVSAVRLEGEEYYYNVFFRTKITLLVLIAVHALIFRPTVYNRPEELDRLKELPTRAKVAGALSLTLWTCVMIAGRGIGYIEVPFGLHAWVVRMVSLG